MSELDIKINETSNNVLCYFPRAKSNYEMVNTNYEDLRKILYFGCMYYPNLLANLEDITIFNKLKDELNLNNDISTITKWSKHFKIENPETSQTFTKIVNLLGKYFNVDILQTRINYYTYESYKPFHHDSHAYTDGQKEDITIGCSFGSSRTLVFKKDDIYFNFPQNNGDVFCFDHITNKLFMHGIQKLKNNDVNNERISIVIWGKKI